MWFLDSRFEYTSWGGRWEYILSRLEKKALMRARGAHSVGSLAEEDRLEDGELKTRLEPWPALGCHLALLCRPTVHGSCDKQEVICHALAGDRAAKTRSGEGHAFSRAWFRAQPQLYMVWVHHLLSSFLVLLLRHVRP